MLDFLYTDDITVKYNKTGDTFSGYTYSTKVIKGCLQSMTKSRTDGNGSLVVTSMLLNTKENLSKDDLITCNGKDYKISSIDICANHLMGGIDHYEIRF